MKPKVSSLKKTTTIENLLNLQPGKSRREKKTHITNIRNKRGYITIDHGALKW